MKNVQLYRIMLFAFETSINFLSININCEKKKNHNYCAIKNLSTCFKKFYYFHYFDKIYKNIISNKHL